MLTNNAECKGIKKGLNPLDLSLFTWYYIIFSYIRWRQLN